MAMQIWFTKIRDVENVLACFDTSSFDTDFSANMQKSTIYGEHQLGAGTALRRHWRWRSIINSSLGGICKHDHWAEVSVIPGAHHRKWFPFKYDVWMTASNIFFKRYVRSFWNYQNWRGMLNTSGVHLIFSLSNILILHGVIIGISISRVHVCCNWGQ